MTATLFWSPKRGVGVTATALAYAIATENNLYTTQMDDATALAGVSANSRKPSMTVNGNTAIRPFQNFLQNVDLDGIIDGSEFGELDVQGFVARTGVHTVLVGTNEYLSLKHLLATDIRGNAAVVRLLEGLSLEREDVEHMLNVTKAFTLDSDIATARTLDAGLISTRMPQNLKREMLRLENHLASLTYNKAM